MRQKGYNIEVTKEDVVQESIHDACVAQINKRYISAHILANTACEVVRHLAKEYTKFSAVDAYWSAIKSVTKSGKSERENKKIAVKLANTAYNFLKHSDKDFDKELCFDTRFTKHFIYLCIFDLNRLKLYGGEIFKNITFSEDVEKYMVEYCQYPHSLSEIKNFIIEKEIEESETKVISFIVEWINKHTDFNSKLD